MNASWYERGAVPQVPALGRGALSLLRSFTSPLLPDDYLELVNPLWSTRELRGRVVGVAPESADAVTILIKPGWEWPGHRAGQYLRLGVEIDGVLHWRAYSLTSEPGHGDGCIAVTPKLVPGGVVSPYLCERLQPGTIVRLGGVEGTFTLPDPPPERLLFMSAGSGITPIVSMLRSLVRGSAQPDVVHVHSSRTPEQIAFAGELRALQAGRAGTARTGYRLHEWISAQLGRIAPDDLQRICPDWRQRDAYVCGPPGLLQALTDLWRAEGDPKKLRLEHFQPDGLLGEGEPGSGGTIWFSRSGVSALSDGRLPILVAGEEAGATLPHGCRMGICRSCVGRLRAGRLRDLRTGRVHGHAGELVQTCINAPEGPIEIEL